MTAESALFTTTLRHFSLLAIALVLLAGSANAASPVGSHDAVMAAVHVLGRIDGIEMKIGLCRDADPKNKDGYDRAFTAYNASVQGILARVHYILREEARRFGVPEDHFIKQAADARNLGEQEGKRQKTANPSLFRDQCAGIAEDGERLPETLPSIREQLPADTRLIDEWR